MRKTNMTDEKKEIRHEVREVLDLKRRTGQIISLSLCSLAFSKKCLVLHCKTVCVYFIVTVDL